MRIEHKEYRLQTNRLLLRHFKMRDAKIMYKEWCSDPEVTKYMLWQTNTHINQTKKFVKSVIKNYKTNPYHWIIVNKSTNKPIGSIGVGKLFYEENKCEAGYCLSRKYWNNGIMTEAFKAVLDYLLHNQGFVEVIANHQIANTASGKVMQKCGMKYVKSSTLYSQKINEDVDIHIYSITK